MDSSRSTADQRTTSTISSQQEGSHGAVHFESDPWLPPNTPILGDIELVSGRLIIREVDWVHEGPARLELMRSFSSFRTGRDGVLGRGWAHAFERSLEAFSGRLHLREDDGRMVDLGPPLPLWGCIRHPDGESVVTRTNRGYTLFRRGFRTTFAEFDGSEGLAVLHEIRTPDGLRIRFHWDAAGKLRAIEPALARRSIDFVYHSEHGRLIGLVASASGAQLVRYEYDEFGRLIEVGTDTETAVRYEYDADHGMIRRSWPTGWRAYITRLPGDSRHYRTSESAGSGRIEVHVVEAALRSVVIDSAGHASSLQFDAARHILGATDPSGKTRRVERDPLLRFPSESQDRLGQSWQWLYDAQGFPAFLMRPDGSSMGMDHDGTGRPARIAHPDGSSARWAWDMEGALVAETSSDGTSRLYEYGDDGQLLAFITPSSARVKVLFGEGGRVEIDSPLGRRAALLDELGRIVQVIDEDGASRWFSYEERGRVHRAGSSDLDTWTLSYSACGRLSRAASSERVVELERDAGDRIIGVHDGGERTRLIRDARGLVSALEGRTGARFVLVHDARGSMTEQCDPFGALTRLTYDAEQRIQAQTDALGKTRKAQRDCEGRLVRIASTERDGLGFDYDARGAIIRADDGRAAVRFERDACSRVCRETYGEFQVESSFDSNGSRVGLRTSLGLHIHLRADVAGRISRVALGSVGGLHWEVQRTFDAAGREREWHVNSGLRIILSRDAFGRVVSRRLEHGGRELARTEYTYAGGRLVRVIDSRTGLVEYDHDAAGNLIISDPTTGCDVRRGTNVSDDSSSPLLMMGYDGRVLNAHGADYEYDRAGRRVSKVDAEGRTTRYTWDGAGRLVSVEIDGKRRVSYAYDALGRLRTRTVGSMGDEAPARTRHFHWDGARLVHEVEDDEVLSWIWMDDRLVGCFDGERAFTYLWDPRGTVSEVFDASGALVWSAEADPLGLTFTQDASILQPWLFDGHWYDRETGLAMTLFRFFDPTTASYLSPHPFGPAAGLCLYGIPIRPVPTYAGLGLGAGPNPYFGRAISPTLDRELAELVLRTLLPNAPRNEEPPWCDPWKYLLGPFAHHFPSMRLAEAGPWHFFQEPTMTPFLASPDEEEEALSAATRALA